MTEREHAEMKVRLLREMEDGVAALLVLVVEHELWIAGVKRSLEERGQKLAREREREERCL